MGTKRRRVPRTPVIDGILRLNDDQILQLCIGTDCFGKGFADGETELMQRAWDSNRALIEERNQRNWPGSIPYAHNRFDLGMPHRKAMTARNWPPK